MHTLPCVYRDGPAGPIAFGLHQPSATGAYQEVQALTTFSPLRAGHGLASP